MTVSLNEKLVQTVDQARGFKPRAHFVREALVEYLKTLGYKMNDEIIQPPDRAGCGGRKSVSRDRIGLNETGAKYRVVTTKKTKQ